jgi:hypothetical protein
VRLKGPFESVQFRIKHPFRVKTLLWKPKSIRDQEQIHWSKVSLKSNMDQKSNTGHRSRIYGSKDTLGSKANYGSQGESGVKDPKGSIMNCMSNSDQMTLWDQTVNLQSKVN